MSDVALTQVLRMLCVAGFVSVGPGIAMATEDLEKPVGPSTEDLMPADLSGWYVSTRISSAFTLDSGFSYDFADFSTDVTSTFTKTVLSGTGAVGYRFEDMFSVELEGGMSKIKVLSQTFESIPTATDPVAVTYEGEDALGSVKLAYGLVNVAAEVDMGTFIRPYFSAGVGLARAKADNWGVVLPAPLDPLTDGSNTLLNDSDVGYAWQLGVGTLVDVTDRMSLELGYRYFTVTDINLLTESNTDATLRIKQHQGVVGMRFNF